MFAMVAGTLKPDTVEARNKKRVFKAEKLEQLADELLEGNRQIWEIAKATWIRQGVRVRVSS